MGCQARGTMGWRVRCLVWRSGGWSEMVVDIIELVIGGVVGDSWGSG